MRANTVLQAFATGGVGNEMSKLMQRYQAASARYGPILPDSTGEVCLS